MAGWHEPTAADWTKLTRYLAKWSDVFVTKYRPLRHKVYAHRDRLEQAELESLFSATSYRELEKLIASMCALYEALWGLYHNGRKPVLRPRRHSLVEMIERPGAAKPCRVEGEMAVLEAKSVLAEYKLGRTARPSNKRNT